tara:strand:+ start:189 stop:791 length:603 start_codon:yes stop_codon:yes gene_type:complete
MYDIVTAQTTIDCVKLSKLILEKEPQILKEYPPTSFSGNSGDGGTGLGLDSLTSRYFHYNVLNWKGTEALKEYIKLGYEAYTKSSGPIFVKCWSNVMRKGDQIKKHRHFDNYIDKKFYSCGHVSVQVDGTTSTFYETDTCVEEVENVNGMITLFPCYVPHWTNVYEQKSERITCAFDIKFKDFFEYDVHPDARSKWVEIK